MAEREVFLSYRSSDRPVAERIAQALRKKGLRVFFDQWWLTPGGDWRVALEHALGRCSAFAVLIGPRGLGPWQQREVGLALLRVDRGDALPIVPVRLPNADAPLSLLDLQQWVAIDDAVSDERALEVLARAVRGQAPGPELEEELREGRAGLCPFRGLLAFREEDAAFFVGREEATAQLRAKIEAQGFVVVVGASGTGKSSLVQAGLLPVLRRDARHVWDALGLVPDKRPLHSLAATLLDRLRGDWKRDELRDRIEDWGGRLLRGELPLGDVLGDVLKEQPGTDRVLLFVDQFEETFALCQDPAMRTRFLDVLLDAAQDPRVRVVLTLRADFYGHLQAHRPLTARLDDCVVNVGPLDQDELRRVIVEPARKVALEVEDALVDTLIGGVGKEPGRLPLLQFVLEQMWRESHGRRFDHATYQAVGGIEGAIAHRAEQVFGELNDAQRQAATTLFLRLVQVGEGTRDTRERALLAGGDPALRSVVDRLARGDARLLVTSRDEGSGADAIEISHEALIPSWTWLRDLVQQNRQFLAWRKHARAAVRAFAERHENAVLLRGRYLAEALEFRATRSADLTEDELAFIEASARAAARLKLLRRVVAVALLVLAVAASIGFVQANRSADLAKKRGDALKAHTDEIDRLSTVVHLRAARETEATLYPPWPEKLPAMRKWLATDVKRLRDALPKLLAAVESLKERALPRPAEAIKVERRAHPAFAELTTLRARLESLRRARAVRLGEERVEVPPLPSELAGANARALNHYAWRRVDPSAHLIFGENRQAIAAALAAVKLIEVGDDSLDLYEALDTLAWGWMSVGCADDALAASKRAKESAPEEYREECARRLAKVEAAEKDLAAAPGSRAIDDLERAAKKVEARIQNDRRYEFASNTEFFLFETLRTQGIAIDHFLAEEVVGVEQRLAWAEKLEYLTISNHKQRWDEARDAIQKAHGFGLKPQMGLVPIGMNPVTKLWEFYELRSAWDGKCDPASIAIPTHDSEGRIAVTGDTGIVFVLLPGGTFTMGAQKDDESGPNFDPGAENDERIHEVTLAPFFLARHELTKGQWLRLSGGEGPGGFEIGIAYWADSVPIGYAHAVESVDWTMSRDQLQHHGLSLPSEAQWEYGARGGKRSAWWTGDQPSDLAGAANVIDLFAERSQPRWGRQQGDFDDGFAGLAPVGRYRANEFGLFDVHGNVWEWCADEYGAYGSEGPGDGLRLKGEGSGLRVFRGGSYIYPAPHARSAYRRRFAPTKRDTTLGLRAARILTL
ncbi:MAG: SUMF1/EgtB/PvdO family nonheme iron enzyme [Planctomycetes bacterium]|nr:SUMF1/EgtB/PvdO family nonheme iron enzyme [Planctomycetota bacterium]